MTHTPIFSSAEQTFVPEDAAASELARRVAVARIEQEYKTRRLLINWCFTAGIIALIVVGMVVLGLSA